MCVSPRSNTHTYNTHFYYYFSHSFIQHLRTYIFPIPTLPIFVNPPAYAWFFEYKTLFLLAIHFHFHTLQRHTAHHLLCRCTPFRHPLYCKIQSSTQLTSNTALNSCVGRTNLFTWGCHGMLLLEAVDAIPHWMYTKFLTRFISIFVCFLVLSVGFCVCDVF